MGCDRQSRNGSAITDKKEGQSPQLPLKVMPIILLFFYYCFYLELVTAADHEYPRVDFNVSFLFRASRFVGRFCFNVCIPRRCV